MIGVLPEDFRFLRANPLVIMPFKLDRATIHAAGFNYQGLARLKPGVTIAQANADVERLLPTLTERFPLPPGFTQKMFDDAQIRVAGAAARRSTSSATSARCCGFCSARSASCCSSRARTSPTCSWCAPRRASRSWRSVSRLAPKRRRVAWELMSESLLVALLGGVVGIALAYGGIQLLVYLQPAQLPRLNEIALDPIVLLFTLAISLGAGLLFGAIPIVKYARPHMAAALKDSSRGSSEGRERHRARNTLVVAQVGAGRGAAGRVGPDGADVPRHSRRAAGFPESRRAC